MEMLPDNWAEAEEQGVLTVMVLTVVLIQMMLEDQVDQVEPDWLLVVADQAAMVLPVLWVIMTAKVAEPYV